eukprot:9248343-Alexandrium_andersonii.AAC.1
MKPWQEPSRSNCSPAALAWATPNAVAFTRWFRDYARGALAVLRVASFSYLCALTYRLSTWMYQVDPAS